VKRTITVLCKSLPPIVAAGLLISACGGGSGLTGASSAVQTGSESAAQNNQSTATAPSTEVAPAAAAAAGTSAETKSGVSAAAPRTAKKIEVTTPKGAAVVTPAGAKTAADPVTQPADQQAYAAKGGATDIGVSKDAIKLGSVSMHGLALGNVLVLPVVRGNLASTSVINDRGGVLGRRLTITDCDDGPGEVSRAKSCIKKLAGEDHIFSLITAIDWATASIHDDLKQFHLPYIGAWAYSQTEWQDPFMFPTHMSMIHEAMAGAHWAANVIKPRTYGLVCLTSPEMQLACDEVTKIMNASGAKLVKRSDLSISEVSMSATVLSMRAANPEHIIHYVINPATMVKFMIEARQQGYYPPKGISGNHLAAEVLGSLFGEWPAGRYWTNTTYKMWGPELMAAMNKYTPGNRGMNHHIVQAGYVAVNIFAQAAKEVGPNLTRDRLRAQLGNGTVWKADASLDQRFAYTGPERYGSNWSHDYGQGREFMYKYTSAHTVANPDGSPSGFEPDPNEFVINTWK